MGAIHSSLSCINTRLTITGAWFRTEYHNSQPIMYKPAKMVGGEPLEIVGIYKDANGFIREMVNTNFTFDTTIPKLKLGFSLSAQCVWLTAEQSMRKENMPLEIYGYQRETYTHTPKPTHTIPTYNISLEPIPMECLHDKPFHLVWI